MKRNILTLIAIAGIALLAACKSDGDYGGKWKLVGMVGGVAGMPVAEATVTFKERKGETYMKTMSGKTVIEDRVVELRDDGIYADYYGQGVLDRIGGINEDGELEILFSTFRK